jgi:hypothetical protein
MTATRDDLRQVAQDFHLGALLLRLEAIRPMPGHWTQLLLKSHECLLAVGLADRAAPAWEQDPVRRAVWLSGLEAKPVALPEQVEAWVGDLLRRASVDGEYATVGHLLASELASDPGALAEVAGRLAAMVVGRVHS